MSATLGKSSLPADTRSGGMGIVRPAGSAIPGLAVPGVGMVTTKLTIGAGAWTGSAVSNIG